MTVSFYNFVHSKTHTHTPPNMSDENMTPEERDRKGWDYCRRIFNTFDKEQEEWIAVDDLATVVRLCGMCPTEDEVEEIQRIGDPESTHQITWPNFQNAMEWCMNNFRSEKVLTAAFQSFVPNERKSISKTSLRYALQNYGDKMADAEINQFIDACPMEFSDGVAQISELVQKLLLFWSEEGMQEGGGKK